MTSFRGKALLGGMVVVVALLGTAVAAHASRFLLRNSLGTTAWRATWSELNFSGGFGTVTCRLTLEGSMHSATIVKTRGSLVGHVTNAAVSSSCGIFASRVLTANLPWHVRYQSFSGVLPNISNVAMQIIGFEFQIRESGFGVTCLYRSTEAQPLNMIWSRNGATGVIASATLSGTITSADCGLNGEFAGTSTSFTPSTTITLI